jgi:hypothetical protein
VLGLQARRMWLLLIFLLDAAASRASPRTRGRRRRSPLPRVRGRTLIFMAVGASAVISLLMRSAMPGNRVVPPDSTMLLYRSFLMSTSHCLMDWKVVSWMPSDSMPIIEGLNSTSGQRKRSLPMVMTCARRGGVGGALVSAGLCHALAAN